MFRSDAVAGLIVLGLLAAAQTGRTDTAPANPVAKASKWEKAAVVREEAAAIQVRQAQRLLDLASGFRSKADLHEEDLLRWFEQAGDAEWRAGELYGFAVVNFERAAQDWQKAADEYRREKAPAAEAEARTRAGGALKRSAECGDASAQAYERCSEALGPDLANDTRRAGKAGEKAAEWHEKVAERDLAGK
jgi:hypothetical protein